MVSKYCTLYGIIFQPVFFCIALAFIFYAFTLKSTDKVTYYLGKCVFINICTHTHGRISGNGEKVQSVISESQGFKTMTIAVDEMGNCTFKLINIRSMNNLAF